MTGLCRCEVELKSSSVGQIAVRRVIGELDSCDTAMLAPLLGDCIALRPTNLVVDLTELSFCSARGMAVLVERARPRPRAGSATASPAATRHCQSHDHNLGCPGPPPLPQGRRRCPHCHHELAVIAVVLPAKAAHIPNPEVIANNTT
ncbi:MAG TPA: STAS domain-containing protein [Pseudonocardiaceae bacterium]